VCPDALGISGASSPSLIDPSSRFLLDGKVVLITGTSVGLGRHFAATFAQVGAHVVFTARRIDPLRVLVESIQAAGGKALGAVRYSGQWD